MAGNQQDAPSSPINLVFPKGPQRIGYGVPIQVEVNAIPDGEATFSIDKIAAATDITMREDPDTPGLYRGLFFAPRGIAVQGAAITVTFKDKAGNTSTREAQDKITVDTVLPVIDEASISLDKNTIRNGEDFIVQLKTKAGSTVKADVSDVDTQQKLIVFQEDLPSTFSAKITVSADNRAANGKKIIRIFVEDAFGNKGTPATKEIGLQNIEFDQLYDIDGVHRDRLDKSEIRTLSELRRANVDELAPKIGIDRDQLSRYQAEARFLAIGIDKEVARALVDGGILSVTGLAIADTKDLEKRINDAIGKGTIPQNLTNVPDLAFQLRSLGSVASVHILDTHSFEMLQIGCKPNCTEPSVFSCYAYLLELQKISKLGWDKFRDEFKQDVKEIDQTPVRTIDIAVKVLERVLKEDQAIPVLPDAPTYDSELNSVLMEILIEATGETQAKLKAKYPTLFNRRRAVAKRNADIEQQILQQNSADANKKIEQAKIALNHIKLGDYLDQASQLEPPIKPSDLRKKYFISFSLSDCPETTKCHQAILTLQEYLAKKAIEDPKYEYPTYDEWRLDQVEKFYPENIYMHEFKTPFITGDRQLLGQHLELAFGLLESILVSKEGGYPDPASDLLSKNLEYASIYNNLKIGLGLIRECYEIDNLINKGHTAYFHEEYQQAWQFYLEAAEQIRLTSHKLSERMELKKLWDAEITGTQTQPMAIAAAMTVAAAITGGSTQGTSYFNSSAESLAQESTDFFEDRIVSYQQTSTSNSSLEVGPVKLQGISDKSFKKMGDSSIFWDDLKWRAIFQVNGWDVFNPFPYAIAAEFGMHIFIKNNALVFKQQHWKEKTRPCFLRYVGPDGKKVWQDISITVSTTLLNTFNDTDDDPNFTELKQYIWQTSPAKYCDCFILLPFNPSDEFVFAVRLYGYDDSEADEEILPSGKPIPFPNVGGDPTATSLSVVKINLKEFNIEDYLEYPVKNQYQKRGEYKITLRLKEKRLAVELELKDENSGGWSKLTGIDLAQIPDLPDSGFIGLGSWGCGIHNTIAVQDLSQPRGPVSDSAFFLDWLGAGSRTYFTQYVFAYLFRGQQSKTYKELISAFSYPYEENNWIIGAQDVGKARLNEDPLTTQGKSLRYDREDHYLRRDNLRQILDALPMLFCHQYFFLLPICLGDVAKAQGRFEEALQWYRMVYDERQDDNIWPSKSIYPFLNPRIEKKMMCIRVAQNYADWADYLFNQNTEESIQEARIRYNSALMTLSTSACCDLDEELNEFQLFKSMGQILASAKGRLQGSTLSQAYRCIDALQKVGKHGDAENLVLAIRQVLNNHQVDVRTKEKEVIALIERKSVSPPTAPSIKEIVDREAYKTTKLIDIEKKHPVVFNENEISLRIRRNILLDLQNKQPNPPTGGIQPLLPSTLAIPFIHYSNPVLRRAYEMLETSAVQPRVLIPAQPTRFFYDFSVLELLPTWVWADLCIPQNPSVESITEHACQGIKYVDRCFTPLGFPHNDLSSYRFEYLISLAKNYVQMALTAEKDFIHFKDLFEKESLDLASAAHAAALAAAGVQMAQFRVDEANRRTDGAWTGIARVNAEIYATQKRLDELGSPWAIIGIVAGAIAAAVAAYFSAGTSLGAYGAAVVPTMLGTGMTVAVSTTAGIGAGIGGGFSYQAGLESSEKDLRMKLQLLKGVEYNNAQQNLEDAAEAEKAAKAQARIAELDAEFVAEKAKLLATEFFNPQLWSFLARESKKFYQTYLTYATMAAWMAQRALEFEQGLDPHRKFATSGPTSIGSGLNIIRFDYFQPSQQGLLGAEMLQLDIAELEQAKFLNQQRKDSIPKVISLASTRPFLFAKFLEEGVLAFNTTLEEFDEEFPGHYQRRIRSIRINLFGLVGPEGIHATLTCLGSSQVVVKEYPHGSTTPRFTEKTLRRLPETVAISIPIAGGAGQIPGERLNPFEGMGVAAQWIFEMPKAANKIDYSTITDIQFIIEYTALFDPTYRNEVIERLPETRTAIRAYSFCRDFSDACLYLHDSTRPIGMIETNDKTTGAYTLKLETRATDFPPNQLDRQLIDAIVYFHPRGTKDYSTLRAHLSCRQLLTSLTEAHLVAPTTPTTEPDSIPILLESNPPNYIPKSYLGRVEISTLQVKKISSVVDTWYLYISPDDPANTPFIVKDQNGNPKLVGGHKVFDFSDVQDVIFALHYEYKVPPFPPQ